MLFHGGRQAAVKELFGFEMGKRQLLRAHF